MFFLKLLEARKLIDSSGRNIRLEVDGGVNASNIAEIAKWGADTFVAGTAIFNTSNYQEAISEMKMLRIIIELLNPYLYNCISNDKL